MDMAQVLVVADDLTGANATGVLLKKNGFVTYTVLEAAHGSDPQLADCECLVVPTESRAIEPREAYDRVRDALLALKGEGVKLYAKRIDSTLRGNLGRETDAFLDVLGPDYVAVCVPCFPSSGRVLVGGYLLVNGVPLQKTEVAKDPKNPITTSSAKQLYLAQSRYPLETIHLDDIAKGIDSLAARMGQAVKNGARILVCDSVTMEDMETIVDALLRAGIRFIPVDPGVFTATAAKRVLPRRRVTGPGKVLMAIGSVNGVARAQVKALLGGLDVGHTYLEIGEVLESPRRREAEICRAVDALLAAAEDHEYLAVIGSGIDPARRVPFEPYLERDRCTVEDLSQIINDAMAQVALRALRGNREFRAIYSTGGDISAAINRQMGTAGLRLLDEVVPLAGYGELLGGEFSGMKFISKGGMVGDEQAMVTCARYLRE